MTPADLKDGPIVLDGVDREVAFNRRRAGQVFFYGLLTEGLILAGREIVIVPDTRPWTRPLVYSALFIAVAVVGIALGYEYRQRIHILKSTREVLLSKLGYKYVYPLKDEECLSEIQVLYVVLTFLSSAGIMLSWWNRLSAPGLAIEFWIPFYMFVVIGALGILYSLANAAKWVARIIRASRPRELGEPESGKAAGGMGPPAANPC